MPGALLLQSSYRGHGATHSEVELDQNQVINRKSTEISTGWENAPWWQADLKASFNLSSLRLGFESEDYPDGLRNFYVFLSDHPIAKGDLQAVLAAPDVEHLYVSKPFPSNSPLPLGNRTARYVRLQLAEPGRLVFKNVSLFGCERRIEIAGNGIDDDNDGKIDCDDSDLRPTIRNVLAVPPSCPGCSDGAIHVAAAGENLQFSLDGGQHLQPVSNSADGVFSIPVASGTYQLVLFSPAGCPVEYRQNPLTVESAAPEVIACQNGNFANGWQNWTGGLGYHDIDQIIIDNQTIDPAGLRHRILQNTGANDPTVGALIPLGSPTGQANFARLGDPEASGFSYAVQRLRLCFTVTPANANFNFWYAAVLWDGEHAPAGQAFFQWSITTALGQLIDGNKVLPGEASDMERFDEEIYYQGWTCVAADLSAFVGQQVCVEFMSGCCGYGGHGGYAYIDGICETPALPTIAMPATACTDLRAVPTGGADFNWYFWKVEQVDANGNPIPGTAVSTPTVFTSPIEPFDFILKYWKTNLPNGQIHCGDRFRVSLNLIGRCRGTVARVSAFFTVACPPPDLDYCDLEVCPNATNVQMSGTGAFSNYQFNWSPAAYLNDPHAAFPVITNPAGYNATYTVTITNAIGCTSTQTVAVRPQSFFTGVLSAKTECYDECHVKLVAEYLSNMPFNPSLATVWAVFSNPSANYAFTFVSSTALGNGVTRYRFGSTLPVENKGSGANGDTPVPYTLYIQVPVSNGFCRAGDCNHLISVESTVAQGIFWGTPDVWVPNIFCPNAVNNPDNALFYPSFSQSLPKPGVYWMKMQIWEHPNDGLVYENTYNLNPSCATTQGLAGNEPGFPWNGYWANNQNGDKAVEGVYTCVITYRNCSGEVVVKENVTLEWACGQ